MIEVLEVRCCCQPQKLLGWIQLPPTARAARIVLPIEMIQDGNDRSSRHLAFKSEETPIERLRLIRGFVENRP